jgi:hypothetical protein
MPDIAHLIVIINLYMQNLKAGGYPAAVNTDGVLNICIINAGALH